MADTVTSYMSLTLPEVSVKPSPTWATMLNTALSTVDAHDHTTGYGKKITPAAINMNASLDYSNQLAIDMKGLSLATQLSGLTDARTIYSLSGELYYRDASSNSVQITSSGSVNAGAGSIGGLPSGNAAVTYVGGTTTLWLYSNNVTNVPMKLNTGDIWLREASAGITAYVKLKSPSSLAADYDIIFPAALPASTSLVTIDTSGNLAADRSPSVDDLTLSTSLQYAASPTNKYILKTDGSGNATWGQAEADSIATDAVETAKIKDDAVTTAKILDDNVTTAKILNANVTRPKLSALGQQVSSSSGNFQTSSTSFVDVTNLSITITTTGRPVMLMCMSDADSNGGHVGSLSTGSAIVAFTRDGSYIGYLLHYAPMWTPSSSLQHVDIIGAGTYNYKVRLRTTNAACAALVKKTKLVAFEL
ncbi:MAG: hypothetical protein GY861_01050 [bacterium]|nr:hypothetical protein [bacterium]